MALSASHARAQAALKSCVTAENVHALVQGDLTALASDAAGFLGLQDELTQLKQRCSPVNTCPAVLDALRVGDHARVLQAVAHAAAAPACAAFASDVETLTRALQAALQASAAAVVRPAGVSTRIARAGDVQHLFTENAGITRFSEDTPLDRHGNAAGREFDLGRDGAFQDFRICIYAQYAGEGLLAALQGHVSTALKRKGFEVSVVQMLPSGEKLQAYLKTVSQLWLVSHKEPILSAADMAIIVREWREQRLALYIFGDNAPYFHDANVLLNEIGLPEMKGNYAGAKYCVARDTAPGTAAGTLASHYTTTGVQRLYEGETIAHFDLKVSSDAKSSLASRCHPVMVNTEGRVTVFVLDAEGAAGALIGDGAFTKLFCGWDTAGSSRFVVNCACFLAAFSRAVLSRTVAAPVEETTAPDTVPATSAGPSLITAGALQGPCAITFETEVLALLLARVPPEVTQTDAAVNSPLAQGAALAPFIGRQACGLEGAAKALLTAGFDPFTRQELVAALPALDLSFPSNLSLLLTALCVAFTSGKARYRHASLLLFGAIDELLCRDGGGDIADVLQYMREQLLQHVQCACDFGFSAKRKNTTLTVSKAVALRDAMLYVASAVPAMQRVLVLDAVETCVVIRTLAARCATHISAANLVAWLRHAYVFFVLQCAAARACARAASGLAADDAFDAAVASAYFATELGVSIANTGHVVPFDSASFAAVQTAAMCGVDAAHAKAAVQAFERAAACLGLPHALGTPETAARLFALVRDQRSLPSFTCCSAEARLKTACDEVPALWDGCCTVDAAVEALNAPFATRYFNDAPIEPFATCLGASVFESKSGGVSWFPWQRVLSAAGEPRRLTADELEDVRRGRAAYLRRVYATDDNGNTHRGSANFPLHRCVREEMTRAENRDLMSAADDPRRADAIAHAIAARLVADGSGAYMQAGLEVAVRFAMDSYLQCRRAGMRENFAAERLSLSCVAYEELVQRHRGTL